MERWRGLIDRDPYYNPNLTRTALDFSARDQISASLIKNTDA
jgi:hypothetical protein